MTSDDSLKLLITGKLDIGKSVEQINTQLVDIQKKISQLSIAFTFDKQLFAQINNLRTSINSVESAVSSTGNSLADKLNGISSALSSANKQADQFSNVWEVAYSKLPKWATESVSLALSFSFIKTGVQYITELNKALTDISVITGKSQQEVATMGLEYQQLAKSMGVSTQEIVKGAVEFNRQGLSQTEVLERTKVSTQYAKVASVDYKESANILTFTVNSMGVSIQKASDVFSSLGTATKTGADQMGQAFNGVGSTAGELNLSFEKTASWVAYLTSQSQDSAGTIGKSVASILERVKNIQENGFDQSDGTKLSDYAEALSSVGISMEDSQGKVKNFATIMDELGTKFSSLDNDQKAYLATTIAGANQQQKFLTLMNGYKNTIPLYQQALESAGSTQQKFALYQEGIEASVNRFRATIQGIWQESIDPEAIKSFLDSVTLLATGLGFVIDKIGLFPSAVAAVTASYFVYTDGALAGFYTKMQSIYTLLKTSISHTIVSVATSIRLAGVAATAGSIAIEGFSLALTGLKAAGMAILPVAIFTGLAMGIQALINIWQENKQKQEEIEKQNKSLVDSYSSHGQKIDELVSKYKELKEASSPSVDQQKELIEVQNELAKLLPTVVDHYDEQGNAILRNSDAVKEEIAYVKELKSGYDAIKQDEFKNKAQEKKDRISDLKKQVDELSTPSTFVDEFGTVYEESTAEKNDRIHQLTIAKKELSDAQREYNEFVKDNVSLTLEQNNSLSDLNTTSQEFIKTLVATSSVGEDESVDDYKKKIDERITATAKAEKAINDAFSGGKTPDNLSPLLHQIISNLMSVGIKAQDAQKFVVDLLDQKSNKTTVSIQALKNTQDDLFKTYSEYDAEISGLNGTIADISNGKNLNSSEINNLIAKYPEMLSYLKQENGHWSNVGEAVTKVRDAKVIEYQTSLATSKARIQNETKMVQEELNLRNDQINGIKRIMQAEMSLLEGKDKGIENGQVKTHTNGEGLMYASTVLQDQEDKYAAKQKALLSLQESYNKISTLTIGENYGTPASSSSKQGDSPISKEEQALKRLDASLAQIQQRKEAYSQTSQQYRNELSNEKAIIQQKIDIYQKELSLLPDKNRASDRSNELTNNIANLKTQLSQLTFDSINSSVDEFKNKNNELDNQIQQIEYHLVQYPQTSQQYRDALDQETKKLQEEQINLHKANELIRTQLQNTELTQVQKEKLNQTLIENSNAWTTLQKSIDEKKLEIVNSRLAEQKERTDQLSKSIELSQAIMDSISDKSSTAYLEEYANYLALTKQKEQSLQNEIAAREKEIALNQKNTELIKKLRSEIVDLTIEQLKLKEAFENATVDKIIDLYKGVYEQQKKVALDAIEEEVKEENQRHKEKLKNLDHEKKSKEKSINDDIKNNQAAADAEEERHKKAIDALDDEMNKYKSLIDERMKSIDRESSTKEYDDQLGDLQAERQQLQQQINSLSLDDSYEAKLQMSELNKQLAEKDKEIENLNYKRNVEVRKDNLQDNLDAYQESTDKKKQEENEQYEKAKKQLEIDKEKLDQELEYYKDYYDKLIEEENNKHDNILEHLDQEKERTENYYNQLLADESQFAEIRKAILSGNLTAIKGDFNMFAGFLTANMNTIGKSITENLLAKLAEAQTALTSLNNMPLPSYNGNNGGNANSDGGTGGNTGGGNNTGTGDGFKPEWKQYKAQVKQIVDAKQKWKDAYDAGDQAGMNYWADQAKPIYAQLPSDLASLLKQKNEIQAQSWYQGHFHTGGIVGGKSDSLTEFVNKMFNLKPSEGIAKVLEGELFITPQNIARNFIPNMQNLLSNLRPSIQLAGSGGQPLTLNFSFEKFAGNETDANFIVDKVINGIKKRGGRV